MNLTDRRVGKTRKAIFDALSELLQEKKYSKITIQEIIDKANVGRATFYSHFPTKDELLVGIIENFLDVFNEQLNDHIQGEENNLIPVATLFAHVQDNEKIIRGILMSESEEVLFDKFKSYWSIKIQPVVEAHTRAWKEPKIPRDMLINHVISTIVELIKFWLKNGLRYTPKQMEQYFFQLIYPVFSDRP